MNCTSCGKTLKSEDEVCVFCGNKPEGLMLPEEDDTLPSTPWHHSDSGDGSLASSDRHAVSTRHKILIDESHKERTWSEEFKPFKQYLRGRGRLVVGSEGPLEYFMLEGVKLVVVGGPEHPWLIDREADQWHEDEITNLRHYVENGGNLLVMADHLSNAKRMSTVTQPFGITFSSDNVGDVTVHRSGMARHPILEGVGTFCLGDFHGGGGFYLDVTEPAFALARIDDRPVFAACYHGQGMVVVISSLMIFSEQYLSQADNQILLERLVDEVMQDNLLWPYYSRQSGVRQPEGMFDSLPHTTSELENLEQEVPEVSVHAVEEGIDEVEQYLDFSVEPDADFESEGVTGSFEACESMWQDTLDALIELWEIWDDTHQTLTAEYEVVEDASFPDDRAMLMDFWKRDIEQWQPKFIDLLGQELSLWGEMNAMDAIDSVSQRLLHDLQVNRTTAIVQREQYLDILKLQLEAMDFGDEFAVEELFQDATESSYASALIRNDYIDLLQNLQSRGLPIPQKFIPEREEMRKEDWERGWSIIEWMLPVELPGNGKVHTLSFEKKGDEGEESFPAQDYEDDVEGQSDQDSIDLRAA